MIVFRTSGRKINNKSLLTWALRREEEDSRQAAKAQRRGMRRRDSLAFANIQAPQDPAGGSIRRHIETRYGGRAGMAQFARHNLLCGFAALRELIFQTVHDSRDPIRDPDLHRS